MPVGEPVPVDDRRDAQQGGEQGHRREAELHCGPTPFAQHSDEEVEAAEVGRGQHHGVIVRWIGHANSRPVSPGKP